MQIDLTKLQQPKQNQSSHPEIQEFCHEAEDPETDFLELTVRCEGFKCTPHSLDDVVHFTELIEQSPSKQGSTEQSQCLAISVETQTLAEPKATPNGKNIFRVCIVNEQGERCIDTLVAPQVADVPCKGGTKQALLKYAQLKAEPWDRVKARVLSLIKGKSLVAYHLPQKLADLALLSSELGEKPMYDVAKIFRQGEPNTSNQVPISILTEKYLNLSYKKRPTLSAFTDAKISMALYKQWQKLSGLQQAKVEPEQMPFGEIVTNVSGKGASDLAVKSTAEQEAAGDEDVIVLDGAKLKSLIKDYARECIREELANVLKMLTTAPSEKA